MGNGPHRLLPMLAKCSAKAAFSSIISNTKGNGANRNLYTLIPAPGGIRSPHPSPVIKQIGVLAIEE